MKGEALVLQGLEDTELISGECPGVLIVWSAMLSQTYWRGVIDQYCRKSNRELWTATEGRFGLHVPHPKIHVDFSLLLGCWAIIFF